MGHHLLAQAKLQATALQAQANLTRSLFSRLRVP